MMRARARLATGIVAGMLLLGSCGGDDGGGAADQGDTSTDTGDTANADDSSGDGAMADDADDSMADGSGDGSGTEGENTEPGQLRSWTAVFTGAYEASFQGPGGLGEPDLRVSTGDCGEFTLPVWEHTTKLVEVVVRDADVPPGATGTYPMSQLTVSVIGTDGFTPEAEYEGSGELVISRYDGGSAEQRRITFQVSGTATGSDGSVDVDIAVDWNDSCDRA